MKYPSQFIKKEQVAEQTYEYFFSKPDGFSYEAGQFISLYLDDVLYEFTLVSSPTADHLSIATRLRGSEFKQRLHKLKPDERVEIEGPFGQFILHKQDTPIIFIAGGVGITPFMSMIRSGLKDATVFYSFRTRADALYLNSLSMEDINVIPSITREKEVDNWAGEYGRITPELLQSKLSPDQLQGGVFYLSGSPSFVNDMMELVTDLGVNEERIRVDSFAGY